MSASPPLSFGAWLRQQRESRDWTQQDLAARIGCATITLRKIEADERRPSRQVAALLAEQLGVPPRDRAAFVKFAREASAGDFAEKFLLAPAATQSVDSLPSTPTPLIGRAAELETARVLLLNKKTRLLTLTGTGGIGKTRLAVALAAKLAAHFEDGVYWIDLSALRDPAHVLSAIAQTLGVRDNVRVPLLENLQDYLRHKQVLLVLDNFEQVIAAAGEIAALLEKARRLKTLVTSRERLHVAGECDLSVPPLELPDLKRVHAAPQLYQAAAVVLFVQQARAAKPEFDPARENGVTIAQICHDLEGLPLALELAAARVKILPIKQIASRLENRFRLLRGGPSGTPARHQTLWNAIDWSYELLSEAERALLRRLSAFSGGWSLDAAEAVCAGDVVAEQDVLDLLTSLVDQSLIQVSEHAGTARFRMLETIREYAEEKLVESGEATRVRTDHLEFFCKFAEEAAPKLLSGEQLVWLDRFEGEHDNLRAALDWGLKGRQPQIALRLASAAFWFWWFRGPWSEGQRWLEAALAQTPATERPAVRAKALTALGTLLFEQTLYLAARTYLEDARAIWLKLGDIWWSAFVPVVLGFTLRTAGPETRYQLAQESVEFAKASKDNWILAFTLWNLGEIEFERNNLSAARVLLEESLAGLRVLGEKFVQNEVLAALGQIAEAMHDYPRAEEFYEASLAVTREVGDNTTIAINLSNLGRVVLIQGDNDRAATLFEEAIEWSRRIGKKIVIAYSLTGLGALAIARGQAARAVRLLAASESHVTALGLNLTAFPSWVTLFQNCEESTRAQLDAETFDRAWAEGRAMRLEQAVEYALADKAEPPSLSIPSPRHSKKLNS